MAVGSHHDLPRAQSVEGAGPLAALLHVADLMCLREGMGRRKPNSEILPWASPGAELLGLGEPDFSDLMIRFLEMFEEERELFG